MSEKNVEVVNMKIKAAYIPGGYPTHDKFYVFASLIPEASMIFKGCVIAVFLQIPKSEETVQRTPGPPARRAFRVI